MLRSGILLLFTMMCGEVFGDSDYSADLLLARMTEIVKENGKEWMNLPPFHYSDIEGRFQMSASRGNLISIDSFSRFNVANTTVYGLTLYLNIPLHWIGMTAEYSVNYTGEGGDCSYTQTATANEYDEPVMTVWISAADVSSGLCYAQLDQIQTNSIDDPTLGPPTPDTCGAAVRDNLNSLLSDRFLFDLHYTALKFLTTAAEKALDNLNLCADSLLLIEGNEDIIIADTSVEF